MVPNYTDRVVSNFFLKPVFSFPSRNEILRCFQDMVSLFQTLGGETLTSPPDNPNPLINIFFFSFFLFLIFHIFSDYSPRSAIGNYRWE